MAIPAAPSALAAQARRVYMESLLLAVPTAVQGVLDGAHRLANEKAEPQLAHKRMNAAIDLTRPAPQWQQALIDSLGAMPRISTSGGRTSLGAAAASSMGSGRDTLQLVDDDTIEVEILSSRLALAMMDKASWEFTDLRARMSSLERREELDSGDALRPHVVARIVIDSWRAAGLSLENWRTVQKVIHAAFGEMVEESYHETNRWLLGEGVRPEIDLRPLIRRSTGAHVASIPVTTGFGDMAEAQGGLRRANVVIAGTTTSTRGSGVGEETRLMTRMSNLARTAGHAEAVLGRLNKLVGRQVPSFADTAEMQPSTGFKRAIAEAQSGIQRQLATTGRDDRAAISTPALLQELQQRKQALKEAASTPVERATIEIVALLFQSILTEEKIPAVVRVWFARLQMPVLRVAVSEPDFFATTDHPARKLIDRMGACVMGFDISSRAAGDALDKEIKRVVQVVEAYPDTGRRVFQTVLTEFERFLEHYFKTENEATRKGVSLAQQVEQRETMAIQYTIELRKMLNEVPVQEGVRNFLFHVWADVLATMALKSGAASDSTKVMKRAAADLIWSAGAKVSREERADVIRRLPPLLKTLREGMAEAGLAPEKQDEHIQALNDSLAAAFTAKAAAIPAERLEELMARLEDLEEMLPDADDMQIDESIVMDLSGHESTELQIVTEGGSMPTPAMIAWARELQVGGWYMLEHRGRIESVQLAWHGMRKQLSLFVSQQGRGTLFQQHRLASFLQAGLLVPAQDEALTVRATRSALAKLDADPQRLLN
ncbi:MULTISPECIES: DUF1631 family protein [unclassified Methylibium]|jgi:hypothetical protein|uniref:DUF1631 family protein n=1 Tax=unclassified Methylibium TaxID=2633235 RepID=UPI0006FCD5FC|nr:DUF1631 family protein [Methylibium sp. Root1272]KQW68924.1 hypothetical protein ASC67_09810 [Methylibium sp. Root1272]